MSTALDPLQEIEDMYSDYVSPQIHIPVLPQIPKVHTALIIGANKTEPHIQTCMSQHPDYTFITWSTDSAETDTHINKDINDDSYLDVFQHTYKGMFKMIIIDKSTTKFIVNFNVYLKLKESLTEDGHIFIPLFGSSPGGNAFEMIKRVPEFRLVLNTELKDFHDYFELSVYEGFVFLLSEDTDGYYFDHLNILASLGKQTEQEVMANIFQNIFRDKSFQSKINRLNQIHFFTSLDAIGFVIEEDFDFSHYPLFNPRYETPTSFIKIKKYRPIESASIESASIDDKSTRYESLMTDFSHRYPRENNPALKSFYVKMRSSLGKRRKCRKSRTKKFLK
jgi:hypothetical protein